MKVFVTGGSGFLGSALIKRLIAGGHEVTALTRSETAASALQKLGVQKTVTGHLRNIPEWESSLQGHDVVVHCAAPVEFWGAWEKFHQEITLASIQLAESSEKVGVSRFIYISSEAVLQDSSELMDVNEAYPYPAEPNSYYGKAKKLAEQGLLSRPFRMKTIIIRPAYIWGEGDKALEGIIAKLRTGRFIWIDHGRHLIETSHIDNVVEGINLSLSNGIDKGVYFITDGKPRTIREHLGAVFRILQVPNVPTASLPTGVVRAVAGLCERLWTALKIQKKPPLTRFEWYFMGVGRRYSIARAVQELGYRPVVSFEEGIRRLRG